ncbi:MAG: phytoene/squalene synthase family protein [Phycisphaerae bacterium]
MTTGIDESLLQKSHAYCRELTRKQAGNFYYGLKLLPEPKRSAMYALYAYMRLIDDIADAPDERNATQRIADLEAWRVQTHAVLGDGVEDEERRAALRRHILWPGFADLIERYQIPLAVLDDMIAGQRQDLEPVSLASFDELYQYCYRVASVVGLASICVFGYTRTGGRAIEELAIARGIAFQLTNILRDLREDGDRHEGGGGRCYLPLDELARFGVTPESLAAGAASPGFDALMEFQIARAEEYYTKSAALESHIQADSRPTLRAMTAIYHGILQKIKAEPRRVLRERVRLSLLAKLSIGWRSMRERG